MHNKPFACCSCRAVQSRDLVVYNLYPRDGHRDHRDLDKIQVSLLNLTADMGAYMSGKCQVTITSYHF